MAKVSAKRKKKRVLASSKTAKASSKKHVLRRKDLKSALPIKKLMILGE